MCWIWRARERDRAVKFKVSFNFVKFERVILSHMLSPFPPSLVVQKKKMCPFETEVLNLQATDGSSYQESGHTGGEFECNALESSQNHHFPTSNHGLWKNCLPRNWSLVPKRLGTATLKYGCQNLLWINYNHMGSSKVRDSDPIPLAQGLGMSWA